MVLAKLFQNFLDTMYLQIDSLGMLIVICVFLIMMQIALFTILLVFVSLLLILVGRMAPRNKDVSRVSVGIFHPYCAAGGGGERVLWYAVKALQDRYHFVDCVIYTGNPSAISSSLPQHLRERFNISLSRPVTFIPLSTRVLLEAWLYPRFTLIFQAIGSIFVGIEAMARYRPDVFLDTMGYSFTYPFVKSMTGCKIACYIHYPTISTDMLAMVEDHTTSYNNIGFIANSSTLSYIKSFYYRAFSKVYGVVGRQADLVMVNSSWTLGHVSSLWKAPEKTKLVFPPCDIAKFSSLDILAYDDKLIKKVVSIGQFRPEKNHALQLRSFRKLLDVISNREGDIDAHEVQLVLVGGVRNPEDEKRVKELQDLSKQLGIAKQVEFKVNLPFDDMLELMQEACVGLHTMWNEHFGISVVEMQAAGLLTIANDSGGPRMDIVIPYNDFLTGLLASDVESYAESMFTALTLCDEDRHDIQRAARLSAARFSDAHFVEQFIKEISHVLPILS